MTQILNFSFSPSAAALFVRKEVKLAVIEKGRVPCFTSRDSIKASLYGYGVTPRREGDLVIVSTPVDLFIANVDKPNGPAPLPTAGFYRLKEKSAGEGTWILTTQTGVAAKNGKKSLVRDDFVVEVIYTDSEDAVPAPVVEVIPEVAPEVYAEVIVDEVPLAADDIGYGMM